jgi:UDP-N-acetyl-D-mannosaminuronate dehydrogenase
MESFGISPEITIAARRVNERQPADIASFLKTYCQSTDGFHTSPKIALLGIAFKGKPPTDDVRGTPATAIFDALREAFPSGNFVAFDPVVGPRALLDLGMKPAENLEDAFQGASLALVLNSHPAFSSMPVETLGARMLRPGFIYDCWNNFIDRPIRLPPGIQYIALGSHQRAIAS